jgi:hypothetical protein
MAINSVQELFQQLLKATTPQEVKNILTEIGDVTDIGLDRPFGKLQLHWHAYGNKTSNYSTIGLASKPGRSLTERITNGIDAVLEGHSLNAATTPTSPQSAVNEWFGRPYSSADAGIFNWKYEQGSNDRKVGVILSDSGKREAPTIDVLDYGVGISADNFPSTILSLQEGNKIKKKYLVGAFGQGGSSTLAFCDYVFIVSRNIQNPNIVSFTVIKEITLDEDYKENCSAYLALTNQAGEETVPSFSMNEAIQLYDENEKLRMNQLMNGTLVRHIAFRLTNISKPLSPFEGNLYHYLHCSLFDPLIPFQIIDMRNKASIRQEISTGSRNRLMKIVAKSEGELDGSNTKYKLYRPFAFIRPFGAVTPCVKIEYWVIFNYEKKKNKKTGEEYEDLRTDSNALYVQKKHFAVFALNGQNQGELTISQLTKDLDLGEVSKHLVIHIDVTEAPKNIKNQLFTTNREMLKDGEVLESIKEEIRRILKEDIQLAAIEKELQEKAINEVTESTDDEVKKQIVKLLQDAGFTPSAEGDTVRKGEGTETTDPPPIPPVDPPPPPEPPQPLATLPYPQVTRFEIASPQTKLKVNFNKTALIKLETDGDSRFDKDIRIKFEPGSLDILTVWALEGGRKKWRLKVTETAKVGDTGKISVSLTKPNGDQMKTEIDFEILEPLGKPSKEERGYIPDFEVLPINPNDEGWKSAWENIPADSEEAFKVAYIPRRIGVKTIVYYNTAFNQFKETVDKLKIAGSPLYKFFETNYKVWIGYHGILQYNNQQNETFTNDEQEEKVKSEREKDRALVAQMQVKQALKSSELMLTVQKQKTTIVTE